MSKTQVIMGVERRRKFPDEEKARIVSEMAETSMTAVSKKHGIAMSALSKWKKKFPPKSFALLELNDAPPKAVNDSKPAKQIDPPPPASNVIRVIVQKRIVVEFPLTVEPGAIALFIKALEN